ncbi:MAG: hypothetical protein AABW51_00195 [Nanoarchaeota archaeon]
MVKAEFMDIFGVIGFLILLITGISIIKEVKLASLIIIIISSLGLIVDSYIVIKTFILKK